LDAVMARIEGCFRRCEPRRPVREFVLGLLMELEDHNCWTLGEALGHTGPRDAKSSTDCVGAARQYSGSLGEFALCQVTVNFIHACDRRTGAAFVAGDEVCGGRDLRRTVRSLGMG
jgi:SRSO17 transposase